MCVSLFLHRHVKFEGRKIRIKGRRFTAYVADSPIKQMLGLMHWKGLKRNECMLFVFGRDARYGFWMRNMNFSIDIVWLGEDWRVVDFVENAKPSRSFFDFKTMKPRGNSRYVLEFRKGTVRELNIFLDDILVLH
jgi:uncharacterized membrane protein (UPF0127 family)